MTMSGKNIPPVLGNVPIGNCGISDADLVPVSQALVKVRKIHLAVSLATPDISQLAEKPNPRPSLDIDSQGGIAALGKRPEKGLLVSKSLPAGRAELGK